MDPEIKWSTSVQQPLRFLIGEPNATRLRYCEASGVTDRKVSVIELARFDRLPDFTSFDWSRSDTNLVVLGTTQGDAKVLDLDKFASTNDFAHSFPNSVQRECIAVAFNRGSVLATGFRKHRTDSSLNVYDLLSPKDDFEPTKRLGIGDHVCAIRFFMGQPYLVLAGIHSKGVRLYDLRDHNPAGSAFVGTHQFLHIAIDGNDENYFASAGEHGNSVVSVWDRRHLGNAVSSSFTSSSFSDIPEDDALLDIHDAIDGKAQVAVKSLQFSPSGRGRLSVLSNQGQLRLFNIGTHPPTVASHEEYAPDDATENHYGDTYLYVKRSHDLQFPIDDHPKGRISASRTVSIAFSPHSLADCDGVVALRENGELEVVRVSPAPALVELSSSSEVILQAQSKPCGMASFRKATIAEDLLAIQEKVQIRLQKTKIHVKAENMEDGMSRMEINSDVEASPIDADTSGLTSRQRHARLLGLGLPRIALDLAETLTVADTYRRRCEEGYLFDCAKNREIVRNDPWLMGLWDIVGALEDLSVEFSSLQKSPNLSFAGIRSIWTGSVVKITRSKQHRQSVNAVMELDSLLLEFRNRTNYSAFQGVQTSFPERRKLGLILCGWLFDNEELRSKCVEIVNRGEPYKAIVVAFCHDRRHVAIEMIKIATRAKLVENSGLATIIACDTLTKEQRSLCEWMAEDAKDPYLKALLVYFITSEWKSIADMAQLPLKYRVAVALQHLEDSVLSRFLQTVTEDVIKNGDIEGVLLTGIGSDSVSLFQNYMDRTGDLQTAVLVNAFAVPALIEDDRWMAWKEVYFHNMQSWRLFIPRTRFTVQHSRRSAALNPYKRIVPPPRQVTLRCIHCQRSLAKPELAASHNGTNSGPSTPSPVKREQSNSLPLPQSQTQQQQQRVAPSPAAAAGTICPRCNRHLPRCSLCMLWLGTPDPMYAAPTAVGTNPVSSSPEDEFSMARFLNFCMECGHAFHANHAKEWFAKHKTCPVPGCACMCAVRR